MSEGNGLSLASKRAAAYKMLMPMWTVALGSQPLISQSLPLFGARAMNPVAASLVPFGPTWIAVLAAVISGLLILSIWGKELASAAWGLYAVHTAVVAVLTWHIDPFAATQYAIYALCGFGSSAVAWRLR